MIELHITITDPRPGADTADIKVEQHLNYCRLPFCNELVDPRYKDFCSDLHRSEFHNKHAAKH